MQTALKSMTDFSTKLLKNLVEETTRLEIAGVRSKCGLSSTVLNVEPEMKSVLRSITDFAAESFKGLVIESTNKVDDRADNVEQDTMIESIRAKSYRRKNFETRSKNSGGNPANFKCRSCQKMGHGYRNCPTRFCQACGKRRHDAWEKDCLNYDL